MYHNVSLTCRKKDNGIWEVTVCVENANITKSAPVLSRAVFSALKRLDDDSLERFISWYRNTHFSWEGLLGNHLTAKDFDMFAWISPCMLKVYCEKAPFSVHPFCVAKKDWDYKNGISDTVRNSLEDFLCDELKKEVRRTAYV